MAINPKIGKNKGIAFAVHAHNELLKLNTIPWKEFNCLILEEAMSSGKKSE